MKKRPKKTKKEIALSIILVLCMMVSAVFIVYPMIANYEYEQRQDIIITEYHDTVDKAEIEALMEEKEKCIEYNKQLTHDSTVLAEGETIWENHHDNEEYEQRLNINNDGIMGYIEIPKISVKLPVYHGTDDDILEIGLGHMDETSLPIGGEGTHAVITGHTGLSNKRLFTDLNEMEEGDMFYMYALGEKLAYQVDQILIVRPYEIDELQVVPGKDYMTLVTCTPYGINSHRLFVRGTRVELSETETETESNEAEGTEDLTQTKEPENKNRISTWTQKYMLTMVLGCGFGVAIIVAGNYFLKQRKR